MKRIISHLLDVPLTDPDERRRSQLLNILLLGIVAITLLAIVVIIITPFVGVEKAVARTIPLLVGSLVLLVGLALIFLINRFWSGWLAKVLFLASLTAAFAFGDEPQQVVAGRALFMLVIPILMASVLLRPYASFIVAGLIGMLINVIAIRAQLVHNIFAVLAFFAIALVSWLSALSLERALKDVRTANRELALLYHSGQAFNSTLDLDQVLGTILEEVRHLLNAIVCSVWLTDPATSELVCWQTVGIPGEIVSGWRLAPGEEVAGWVARSGESLIIPDTQAGECNFKSVDQQTGLELRSILCVPLRVRENVLGVIKVADTNVDHFKVTDLELVESLAASAASAIENARLYEAAQQEITERRQAEEALRASEERYRTLFDGVPVGLYRTTSEGRILDVNPALVQILGYPDRQSLLASNVADGYANPENRRRWQKLLERNGGVHNLDMQWRRRDETVIWIRESARTVHDGDGRVLYYEGAVEDITERKQAEEALAEERNLLRTLIDNLPDYIYAKDTESRYFVSNTAHMRSLGATSPDEVVAKSVFELFPQELAEQYYADDQKVIQSGQPLLKREERSVDQTGNNVWNLTTKVPLRDREGKIVGIVGIARDITERKQAEQALRKAHAQNQQLLASISSILIGVDANGRIIQWNTTAERTFGIASTDVVGRPFQECAIQWGWDRVIEAISKCRRQNQPIRLDDILFTRLDGKKGFLGITLNPITEEGGEQLGILVLGQDITERKILESQLAQAQKLEAIGQLAAGVAHEINTPVQYVGDNLRFLQESCTDVSSLLEKYHYLLKATQAGGVPPELVAELENAVDEADVEYLLGEIPMAIQESLEGVARVAEIVQAMREFSHPGVEERAAIDINKAIESTITVARNEWKYVAELETDFDTGLPPVPCLPGEFNQAILNVLVNAAHAIADVAGDGSESKEPALSLSSKGTITVSTRRDGEWVEIRISDTGVGIPEELRPRIFEPFFTTKEVGRGTGQGLAIAHNVVVEKHGGAITFETEVGKGTTFIIRLPIASVRTTRIIDAG